MKKYYLDTCIWIDYYENRNDNFRPLGEWAFKLIKKIIEDEDYFIISDHLIKEIRNNPNKEDILRIFDSIDENLIIRVETSKIQFKEASKLKIKFKIPLGDALHFVIARDNDAILVSRDRHFYELSKDVKKPEDLI